MPPALRSRKLAEDAPRCLTVSSRCTGAPVSASPDHASPRRENLMASPPGDPSTVAADLARLHAEFPGYRIWHEITGNRARLVAVRRPPGISPHTVVTADPAELRAALTASRPPLPPRSLTSGDPGTGSGYPQA